MGNAKDKVRSAHRAFREALVKELLEDPLAKASKRGPYITKNTVLPNIQLTRLIEIHCSIPSKRAVCVFCTWALQTKRATKITKSACATRTCLICSHCNIPLYRDCFYLFYYCVT